MGTGAPRAPFLVARGVPSLRAAGGANVGSVSSGDRGGRALGVRCAIQRRPRSPGFAVAWLCGCAQWHTSGHGRPSSLRTVDGTTTRVSLRARQRGGRGSTGSEVGCVCVCVCVLCLTLLSHGCADMRRWAHTLEHAARLNRACTTARWRGGRRWGGGGLRVHPHRGRRCGRRTFSAVAFARSQESCAGRTTPRVGDCVCVGWRRFLHQYSRNWYIYSSTQHGRKKGAPPAGRTPVLPSSARSS